MLIPCEIAIKYFLPATRASIAKVLARDYKFSQNQIAFSLGITQAAVSKYLSGKYSNKIKKLEGMKFVRKISFDLANSIAEKKEAKIEFTRELCKYCKIFGRKFKCEISKAS
jgi:predicted transcriptional regulator